MTTLTDQTAAVLVVELGRARARYVELVDNLDAGARFHERRAAVAERTDTGAAGVHRGIAGRARARADQARARVVELDAAAAELGLTIGGTP